MPFGNGGMEDSWPRPMNSSEGGARMKRKNGEVRGYCNGTGFCGTVPPLSREKYVSSMGLCVQGSC